MNRPSLTCAAILVCASLAQTGNVVAKGQGQLPSIRSLVKGDIIRTEHPLENDLFTAGLGRTGIGDAAPPMPADAENPTAEELRRAAIYGNFRALIDPTEAGGYGTFYGPGVPIPDAVDPWTIDPTGEGRIPGVEYLAFVGHANVTVAVQIPKHFDAERPCIVAGPSSGSRGVYGAIGTSGEWGLKKGCAVALTDKGTGTGAHDLQDDSVGLIQGERADADEARGQSTFTARVPDRLRERFNDATPNRFAFKHAHSQRNPEADWGASVLQAIEFAFFALNEELGGHKKKRWGGHRFTPENTLVIASSVSNGAGASLRAVEQDKRGLIDGAALTEPNVNPVFDDSFVIQQGDEEPIVRHSRALYDYTTALDVYQGCANLSSAGSLNLTPPVLGANRCQSLADAGLLSATSLPEQAAEAQAILNDVFAIQTEQNVVQPSHWWLFVSPAIAVTYANAYGRVSVLENLCGFSFGATSTNILFPVPDNPDEGLPVPLPSAVEAALFSASNGIPPTGGVNLINNDAIGGPRESRVSTSPSTGRQDQNLDGALCLRALATGVDPVSGRKLRGRANAIHKRIERGIAKIRANGDVHGKPVLIATGRSDAILPINHTSRSYFGLNQQAEGDDSKLRYYEVLNAQHLDALNASLDPMPGSGTRFIPLHHYFIQVHNLLFDHLTNGTPLPPSQVVRTTARDALTALSAANVPDISPAPASADRIVLEGNVLRIPE